MSAFGMLMNATPLIPRADLPAHANIVLEQCRECSTCGRPLLSIGFVADWRENGSFYEAVQCGQLDCQQYEEDEFQRGWDMAAAESEGRDE